MESSKTEVRPLVAWVQTTTGDRRRIAISRAMTAREFHHVVCTTFGIPSDRVALVVAGKQLRTDADSRVGEFYSPVARQ